MIHVQSLDCSLSLGNILAAFRKKKQYVTYWMRASNYGGSIVHDACSQDCCVDAIASELRLEVSAGRILPYARTPKRIVKGDACCKGRIQGAIVSELVQQWHDQSSHGY